MKGPGVGSIKPGIPIHLKTQPHTIFPSASTYTEVKDIDSAIKEFRSNGRKQAGNPSLAGQAVFHIVKQSISATYELYLRLMSPSALLLSR